MGETTGITWTDHTFNPWWGCWKIDEECRHCYADDTANRYAPGLWGRTAPRRFFAEKHWNEPLKWNRKALAEGVRRRVFVGSMCDWAELHPVAEVAVEMAAARRRLWNLINDCRGLDWLLLTKRPENVAGRGAQAMLPWIHPDAAVRDPWPHVWLGVTAGTVDTLVRKVPVLRCIPAAVRFISCEPILEGIPAHVWDAALGDNEEYRPLGGGPGSAWPIHWLIVGDESGHERRPAALDWIRSAREAAVRHGVAFHLKQWNGPEGGGLENPIAGSRKGRKIHLPILDGRQWAQFPTSK